MQIPLFEQPMPAEAIRHGRDDDASSTRVSGSLRRLRLVAEDVRPGATDALVQPIGAARACSLSAPTVFHHVLLASVCVE